MFTLNSIEQHSVLAPPPQAVDGYNGAVSETSPTLGVNCGISTGRNGVLTPVISGSAGFKPRQSAAARSLGYEHEKAPTINTDENYAVVASSSHAGSALGLDHVLLSGGTTFQGRGWYDEVSGCLKTMPHGVMTNGEDEDGTDPDPE